MTQVIEDIVEKYAAEFDEHNAELLARFQQSIYRTRAEGSAQTWTSGAVTYARWLRDTKRKHIDAASSLDVDDYFEYVAGEYDSAETAGAKLDGVKHLYSWLVRKEEVEEDPTEGKEREIYGIESGRTRQAEALRQEEDFIAIDRDQVELLWKEEHLPSPRLRNEFIIKLLWFTGMRCSEICRIRIRDIDREERKITIADKKTDEFRPVWYPARLELLFTDWLDKGQRDSLSPYAEDSNYLFLTHQSDKMRSNHISKIVKKAAKNAGINEVLYVDEAGKKRWKITGHTIRHSMASYHANVLDTKIHLLQEMLGHEKIETTLKYVREDRDALKKAMQDPWG